MINLLSLELDREKSSSFQESQSDHIVKIKYQDEDHNCKCIQDAARIYIEKELEIHRSHQETIQELTKHFHTFCDEHQICSSSKWGSWDKPSHDRCFHAMTHTIFICLSSIRQTDSSLFIRSPFGSALLETNCCWHYSHIFQRNRNQTLNVIWTGLTDIVHIKPPSKISEIYWKGIATSSI